MDRLVASLPSFCSVRPLQYANFVLQAKNAANNATDGYLRNFDAGCCGARSTSEQPQLCELSGPTFDPLRKNLAGWAVTRRTSKNLKAVKIGGWALARGWALAWDSTVCYLNVGPSSPTSTLRPPDIIHVIGVPRPSPFLTALPLPCIILNAN